MAAASASCTREKSPGGRGGDGRKEPWIRALVHGDSRPTGTAAATRTVETLRLRHRPARYGQEREGSDRRNPAHGSGRQTLEGGKAHESGEPGGSVNSRVQVTRMNGAQTPGFQHALQTQQGCPKRQPRGPDAQVARPQALQLAGNVPLKDDAPSKDNSGETSSQPRPQRRSPDRRIPGSRSSDPPGRPPAKRSDPDAPASLMPNPSSAKGQAPGMRAVTPTSA